jgi:hypothetical protein
MTTGSETLAAESNRTVDEVAGSLTLGRLARAGVVARGLVYLIVAVRVSALASAIAAGRVGRCSSRSPSARRGSRSTRSPMLATTAPDQPLHPPINRSISHAVGSRSRRHP